MCFVRPSSDFTSGTANTTYLDADTTTAGGVSMVIPNTNGDFYITLLNANESLMINVPEYQLWLYFDVADENPIDSNNDPYSGALPRMYMPR
jgi:hypothetical protein